VTLADFGWNATLVLALTDEQLAVIEQRRAASDLALFLQMKVVIGYDPGIRDATGDDIWPERSFQETVAIQSEAWARLLGQARPACRWPLWCPCRWMPAPAPASENT
jgi:hypothetical protein